MEPPIQASSVDLRVLTRITALMDLRAALRAADPEPRIELYNDRYRFEYHTERKSSKRNRAEWFRRDEASKTALVVAATAIEAAITAAVHQQLQQQQQQQQLQRAQTDQQQLIVELHKQVLCAHGLATQLKDRSI